MKLSVIIPCYNEINTVERLLEAVYQSPYNPKELVVVDDFSTDGTREKLRTLSAQYPDLKVVYHDKNQGKGAGVRTGFQHATGDMFIIQDADLEYDPQEYPQLVKPIVEGKADVVYGSRYLRGQSYQVDRFWHMLINKGITLIANIVTNLNLTDVETCYKVLHRRIATQIDLKEKRFGFDPEMTVKISRLDCRVFEVGISYKPRSVAEGKKIGWKDGVRVIWCLIRYRIFA